MGDGAGHITEPPIHEATKGLKGFRGMVGDSGGRGPKGQYGVKGLEVRRVSNANDFRIIGFVE